MSDYTNPNLRRSDGVSARGILFTVLFIVLVILGLAFIGGAGSDSNPNVAPVETLPSAVEDGATPPPVPNN